MKTSKFYEIAKKELPDLSNDDIWYVIWNETGYPGFFRGNVKEEFTKQIREYKRTIDKKKDWREKFVKKLRKLLDKAHLLGKQGWEGDKVDNLEIEEFEHLVFKIIEKKLEQQKKEIKEEAIKIIDNIRRFDNKEKGVDFYAGWDESLDLIKDDIVKLL